MSNSGGLKRRRQALLEQDPHCHWCGKDVVYFLLERGQRMPDNFATLDHLNDRIGCTQRPKYGKIVLACKKCNEQRAALRVVELLSIEEIRRLAGNPEDNWKQYEDKLKGMKWGKRKQVEKRHSVSTELATSQP